MLSVASVKSSSGAANYFAKDDYHTGEHSAKATAWGGAGAADAGLQGEVTKEAFEKVLNGELPSGEKVGQVQNRQSGIDLTFSMPKSASVLAYVAGDERVLAAHMAAVKNTMNWVEQKFAEGVPTNARNPERRCGRATSSMRSSSTTLVGRSTRRAISMS